MIGLDKDKALASYMRLLDEEGDLPPAVIITNREGTPALLPIMMVCLSHVLGRHCEHDHLSLALATSIEPVQSIAQELFGEPLSAVALHSLMWRHEEDGEGGPVSITCQAMIMQLTVDGSNDWITFTEFARTNEGTKWYATVEQTPSEYKGSIMDSLRAMVAR